MITDRSRLDEHEPIRPPDERVELAPLPADGLEHHDGEDGQEEHVDPDDVEVGEDLGVDEEERGGKRRDRPHPKKPTAQEVEVHEKSHLPFRSWCRVCMAARGVSDPHRRRRDKDEYQVPMVSLDYAFLRNKPKDPCAVVLVGKDRDSGALMAHIVPMKGAETEWVVKQVIKDIRQLGHHGRLLLRSDQEPAIEALKDEIARGRTGATTVIESSPVGDSQSNGLAERGVRTLEELMRVHKMDLEQRIGTTLAMDHVVFEWMVEFVANSYNQNQVGHDGKTPYQRVRGKRYLGETFRFGEPVMFRASGKVQGGCMQPRWYSGLWVGKVVTSDEHLVIHLEDGKAYRCRTARSMGKDLTKDDLDKIEGRPWAPAGIMHPVPIVAPIPARDVQLRDEGDHPVFVPRNVYITREVLSKVGYSAGCRKCRATERKEDGKGLQHSKECRERIEKAMQDDPVHQERVARAEERKTRYLAEEVERSEDQFRRREVQGESPSNPPRGGDGSATSSSTTSATSSSTTSASSSSAPMEIGAPDGDQNMNEEIPVVSEENMGKHPGEPVIVREDTEMEHDKKDIPKDDEQGETPMEKRRRLELLQVLEECHDVNMEEFEKEWCASLRREYHELDREAVDQAC